MSETKTEIPTLTTITGARAMLEMLAEDHEWVSVFWDRGWRDSGQPLEISIIVDGDGQDPKAWITREVYQELLPTGTIQPNSLKTFKARKLHDFKAPPVEEKTGPTSNDIAETVIRRLFAENPDQPLYAEFYRGLDPNSQTPRVMHEVTYTPAYEGVWFVRLLPGHSDAAISAAGLNPLGLGHDLIGKVNCLAYPQGDDGRPDLVAMEGEEFYAQLVAVVEEKLRDIEAAKARG